MERTALHRFVVRLSRRSDLSEADREAILSLPATTLRCGHSTDVVVPGEIVDHALLVGSGWAARYDQSANGQRELVAIYLPGDMCDLHSVAVPLTAWGIQSLGPATFYKISHANLRQLFETRPSVAMAFWRDTTADASILAKWMGNRGRPQALERMAHLFCELALRIEQAEVGSRENFELAFTQAQLAEMMGVTAVHTNRTLQNLRQTGAISTDGSRHSVKDWKKLVSIAKFDPDYLLLSQKR